MNSLMTKYGSVVLWSAGCVLLDLLYRQVRRRRGNIKHRNTLEICLSDLESFKNAVDGGANSVELCVDRSSGGITPSYGLIRECCSWNRSYCNVHVLIRPRDGNFNYSCDEFDIILDDIIAAKHAGADGVVIGILTSDLEIDIPRMQIVRDVSRPMMLTFHRAFDVCITDAEQAVLQVMSLGCDRLLTSGRSPAAETGSDVLQRITSARDRYCSQHKGASYMHIIGAAGVSSSNAGGIIRRTRLDGLHAGASVTRRAARTGSCSTDRNCNGDKKCQDGVRDFDDALCAGTVCVEEVAVLVDEVEAAWMQLQPK